ncbi:MAG TPA: Hsp20/alpha crystallin family protein [Candidatus Nitrosotenuis sp.]|nr:Hsp20/alpha crystallin family protein [Candidatus Nitrosotenuis sp.]
MWFDSEFERMFRRLSNDFFRSDIFEAPWHTPYYGYRAILINNVPTTQYGNQNQDAREPFVDDILDKDNKTFKLVAEMPGVEKQDIKVTIENRFAHIAAERGNRKYDVRIPLKYKVDENSAKARYANGILEVTFTLKEDAPKGKTISVE